MEKGIYLLSQLLFLKYLSSEFSSFLGKREKSDQMEVMMSNYKSRVQ